MTLRYIDGFSTYNNTFVTTGRWSSRTNSSEVEIQDGTGRTGGDCLYITNTWNRNIYKILSPSKSTWTVGLAFKYSQASSEFPNGAQAFGWYTGGSDACYITLDLSGYFTIRRTGGTALATSSMPVLMDNWYYLEWKTIFSTTSSGWSQLRLNEQVVATASGVSTGANSADWFMIQGASTGGRVGIYNRYTDLYITDGDGSAPYNGYLGDVRILSSFPDGAGNYSAWTPSAGSNYQNVDESTGTYPDSDTTYNETLTVNAKDTFTYANISGTGNIYGVQHNLFARKTDAGTRFIAPMSRQGSTDYVSSTTHTLTDSYTYYTQCQQVNPADSADWEVSDINNSQFGYRLES